MTVRTDDRGTSTTVTHALAIGISSLLVMTLLFGLGGFLDGQQKASADRQVTAIGERVATEVSKAERLARSGDETVTLRVSRPERVAGQSYHIALETADCDADGVPDDGCIAVVIDHGSSSEPRIITRLQFAPDTEVGSNSETVSGGDFSVIAEPDGSDYTVELRG